MEEFEVASTYIYGYVPESLEEDQDGRSRTCQTKYHETCFRSEANALYCLN